MEDVTGQGIELGHRYNFSYDVLGVETALQDKIDRQLKNYVQELLQEYKKFDKIVGYTEVDLDMRFGFHRRNESTYGNFLTDLYRLYVNSDIAFANAGNIRNDCILNKGQLWFSDVHNIIQDSLIVKQLTGCQIFAALQLSVDCLPHCTKGSFLQVSGIKFTYSTKRPPGIRIRNIWINEEPIKMDKKYTAVMISYIAKGADNFEFLKECPIVKDEAETITTTNLVKTFFQNINYNLIPQEEKHQILVKAQSPAIKRIVELQSSLVKTASGEYLPGICPKIEDRICDITTEDDFGSYKFLHEKEECITEASVENAHHLEIDFVDI